MYIELASTRLLEGKELLTRGDLRQAMKALSVSISFNPSTEAYMERAEANYINGDIDAALFDLWRAVQLLPNCKQMADSIQKIDQARSRYESAKDTSNHPPVKQELSAMIPVNLSSYDEIIERICLRPELATDMHTLIRRDSTVLYDIEIHDANPEWAQALIDLAGNQLTVKQVEQVYAHRFFFHLKAPNQTIAQPTANQKELAHQFLQTLDPLLRTLNSDCFMLRTSNHVWRLQDVIHSLNKTVNQYSFLEFYVRLYKGDKTLFSSGMHGLGYPDVEIPLTVLSYNEALMVMDEFLRYQIVNQHWNKQDPFLFQCSATKSGYPVELHKDVRFNQAGEARFNQFGIWKFHIPERE